MENSRFKTDSLPSFFLISPMTSFPFAVNEKKNPPINNNYNGTPLIRSLMDENRLTVSQGGPINVVGSKYTTKGW